MKEMNRGYHKFEPLSRETVRRVIRAIKVLGKASFFVKEVVERVEGVSKPTVYNIIDELARYGFLDDCGWEMGKHYYRVTDKLRGCEVWEGDESTT